MSSEDSVVCPNFGCGERVPKDYVLCPYCGYNLLTVIKEATKVRITIRESIRRIRKLFPIFGMIRNANPLLIKEKTIECMEEVAANADRRGPIIILYLLTFAYSLKIAPFFFAINNSSGFSFGASVHFFLLAFYIFIPIFIALFLLPVSILIWRLVALVIHVPSKYMGGGGSHKETQSLVGYALTPFIIGELVINLILYFILFTVNSTSASELFLITFPLETLLIIPFFIWVVFVAMVGLNKIHNLSYPISGGIAGTIAGLYIVFFVFQIGTEFLNLLFGFLTSG
ncbi:MAG: Yip1 family protein [Candidatus Hodarchaeales archaeon]|jgi:hypothetical protein